MKVTVVKARDLLAMDDDGTSDPFVEVSIRDDEKNSLLEEKTRTKKNTLTPEWNADFTFDVDSSAGHSQFRCMVRDKDKVKSQFMGDLRVPLYDLLADAPSQRWYPLTARPEFPDKPGEGELYLDVDFEPAPGTEAPHHHLSKKSKAVASSEPVAASADKKAPPATPDKPSEAVEAIEAERRASSDKKSPDEGDNDDQDDDGDEKPDEVDDILGTNAAVAEAKATKEASDPDTIVVPAELPVFANKIPLAGELELTLVEARSLLAKDGSTSDPFARISLVSVAGDDLHEQKSKTIKKTVNPEWHEKFSLKIDTQTKFVRIELRDEDRFKSQFLGQVLLPATWLTETTTIRLNRWFKLEARADKVCLFFFRIMFLNIRFSLFSLLTICFLFSLINQLKVS